MQDWLPFFRDLGEALAPVTRLFGTPAARGEIGKGAGGDTTLRIDHDAETVILQALEAQAVNSGQGMTVISEEAGKVVFGNGSLLVLVDPIDGSANAKRGLPLYATTLAVAVGPEMADLRVGFTLNHASGEAFYADRLADGKPHRVLYNWLPFEPHGDLNGTHMEMLGLEMPDSFEELARLRPLVKAFHKTRLLGAMALDIAYVATGGLDAFFHPKPSRPIDFAGSCLFLAGAGGVVLGPDGGALKADLGSLERGTPVLACRTPAIAEKVLAVLGGAG